MRGNIHNTCVKDYGFRTSLPSPKGKRGFYKRPKIERNFSRASASDEIWTKNSRTGLITDATDGAIVLKYVLPHHTGTRRLCNQLLSDREWGSCMSATIKHLSGIF
jgi:hypothetical protein